MLARKVTALMASETALTRRVGSRNQRFKITTVTATNAPVGNRRFALRAMKLAIEKEFLWSISRCTAFVIKKPEMTKNKSIAKYPDGSSEESRWYTRPMRNARPRSPLMSSLQDCSVTLGTVPKKCSKASSFVFKYLSGKKRV